MRQHTSLPREIIYVDVQRTRSLLAQLAGGVIEQINDLRDNDFKAEVQAKILGIGPKGSYGRGWTTEESRSLQDLTFSLFEEAADNEGLILDLPDSAYDSQGWSSNSFQKSLLPGQIIRGTLQLQLLDAGLFRQRIDRFKKMMDALASITTPQIPTHTVKQRHAAVSATRSALTQGVTDEYLESITAFVENFLGESIAMRALPCGDDHLEYSFSGSLLTRADYIQEEREHLFSRYGSRMGMWVCVMQVSAVPENGPSGTPSSNNLVSTSGSISRAAFERMSSDLLAMLEGIGLADGPQRPSVSVTPLAVYRPVEEATQIAAT